jgi:hypothetical protein
MILLARLLASFATVICCTGHAFDQEHAAADHSLVLKIGPALERGLEGKSTIAGAAVAMEVTAIEDWLAVELGATRLSGNGRRANSVELLFKKPFQLSRTAEVMIGLGPQVGRAFSGGVSAKSKSVQFVVDFMFPDYPRGSASELVGPAHSHRVVRQGATRCRGTGFSFRRA